MDIKIAYELLDLIAEKNKVDSNDMNVLLKLSKHDSSEIRAYVAELLVMANISEEAEKILINMCNDKDELVRVNACDSLSAYASIDTYNQLVISALNDKSTLVKSYAILSLVDIMDYIDIDKRKLKTFFLSNSKTDNLEIYAACFKGLYTLGEYKYLNKLLDLTKSENYQYRCIVLNILEDIITDKNRKYILPVIKELRKTESTNAVKSLVDRIISENS